MGSIGLRPGDVRTREQIKRDFGGGVQSGIIPSETTPNVFIYCDPAEAARYGYHWDGWSTDASGAPVFLYTGTGNYGDQLLSGFNGSVLNHREHGRSLHVFLFDSDPGKGGKLHSGLDRADEMRSAVVFRLRPVAAAPPGPAKPASQAADASAGESELVPVEKVEIGTFERDPTQAAPRNAARLNCLNATGSIC